MSEENVQRLRTLVEDFRASTSESARDAMLTRIAAVWDPDVEWDASGLPLPDLGGVVRGREAVRGTWKEFLAAWESDEALKAVGLEE